MSKLGYLVFDADNHLYETEDAFTRHLPSQYRGLIKYVQVNGRTKIAVDNVISDYIPNPTFEVVARPGALADYFAGHNTEGKSQREIIGKPMRAVDAFRSAEPRLRLLDELGVDAALMIPTLASLLEVRLTDDPDLTCTVIHAFNEWLHDEWKFNYSGRIFATPIVNPASLGVPSPSSSGCWTRERRSCCCARHRWPATAAPARRSSRSSTRSGPGWPSPGTEHHQHHPRPLRPAEQCVVRRARVGRTLSENR